MTELIVEYREIIPNPKYLPVFSATPEVNKPKLELIMKPKQKPKNDYPESWKYP